MQTNDFEKESDCGKNDDNVQDGTMEVARLGVDFDMRRKRVATQLLKKLEKVFALYPPSLRHSRKGTSYC